MSDEAEQPEVEESAAGAKTKRERSTITFPYGDLKEATSVADAIHKNVGAGQCDLDQVAGWMGQRVSSGAFRTKVNSARIFGLVKTGQAKLSLTPLGLKIVSPDTQAAAKVDAFLTVPLYKRIFEKYKGYTLPPAVGLEREMAELGVAEKQTDKARQAFHRAAEQAGFFKAGPNQLVRPGLAPVEMDQKQDDPGGGGGGDEPPMHPFVRGLVQALPPSGSDWPEADRTQWLDAAKAIFKLIYKDSTKGSAGGNGTEAKPSDPI